MKILNDREKEIINQRRLKENPTTLEELSKKYKIREELDKLRQKLLKNYKNL